MDGDVRVHLPDELWRRVKAYAARQRETARSQLIAAVKQFLEANE